MVPVAAFPCLAAFFRPGSTHHPSMAQSCYACLVPLPPPSCDVALSTCCAGVYTFADALLEHCAEALAGCQTGICDPTPHYVTFGVGDDGNPDALTVAVRNWSVIPAPPGRNIVVLRTVFEVRLKVSGWPTVTDEGGVIQFPPPDDQHRQAFFAYGWLEAIYRRAGWFVGQRAQLPVKVAGVSIGDSTPLSPQAGVVGGFFTVTADLL